MAARRRAALKGFAPGRKRNTDPLWNHGVRRRPLGPLRIGEGPRAANLPQLPGLQNPFGARKSRLMRRLLLIRHAKAEPAVGRDDFERALTERGRNDARRVAGVLAERNFIPGVLIHSGALRTKQTAEVLASEWPRRVELQEEVGLYDATQPMLFSRTRTLSDAYESVGLVGHNPALGELAIILAGSGDYSELRRMTAKFPTCSVAALDFEASVWDDVERKTGLLSLFLTPSELDAAAD
jgi:phosphohistidine phosphatase